MKKKKYFVEAKSYMVIEANSEEEAIENFERYSLCDDDRITAKLIKPKIKTSKSKVKKK